MPLDWVFPVRCGDSNEELRMSLRCFEANHPDHGDIWIVGYKPNWLTNVHYIPGNVYRGQHGHQNCNVYGNVLAAAEHPDMPDRFVISNDDIMLTEPISEIPVFYIGYLKDQIAHCISKPRTWWQRSLILTYETLTKAGYDNPLSYELHIPIPVDKQPMAETLRKYADINFSGIPPQWRTLYGVVNDIGGVQRPDCKARVRGVQVRYPYFSTTDSSYRFYRNYFMEQYPQPSRYEK